MPSSYLDNQSYPIIRFYPLASFPVFYGLHDKSYRVTDRKCASTAYQNGLDTVLAGSGRIGGSSLWTAPSNPIPRDQRIAWRQ